MVSLMLTIDCPAMKIIGRFGGCADINADLPFTMVA